jgi:hypothetical protein
MSSASSLATVSITSASSEGPPIFQADAAPLVECGFDV